jgi:hypothetical protein
LSADDEGWEEVPQDEADGDVEMIEQQIEQEREPQVEQQQRLQKQKQQQKKQLRGSLGSVSRGSTPESEDGALRVSVLQRLGRNK